MSLSLLSELSAYCDRLRTELKEAVEFIGEPGYLQHVTALLAQDPRSQGRLGGPDTADTIRAPCAPLEDDDFAEGAAGDLIIYEEKAFR